MIETLLGLWNTAIYQPIYNLVIITYNFSPGPSFGWTVIGLAVLIQFLFLYFTLLNFKHEQQLAEVKPLIESIENDKTLTSKQRIEKVSQIIKPIGINPFISSLPLVAQILFLGVLYQIIQVGIYTDGFGNLYSFVVKPGSINTQFIGFELARPSIILALAAAGLLLVERIWEYNKKKNIGGSFSQKWEPLILPLGTFIILLILPSAKAIYLMTAVAFSFIIKSVIFKTIQLRKVSSTGN
ncbi:YidC/Oxa1 family membrane protein insertase [Patescibacteria group bacterium]|nr:YidC/Oxa1 family membrane protein insertase [Patescibacteria group bacterium]